MWTIEKAGGRRAGSGREREGALSSFSRIPLAADLACRPLAFFTGVGQTKYTFSATKEKRRINDNLNCKFNNLIYLIECKKCTKQYIGETKRQLHERLENIVVPSRITISSSSPSLLRRHSLGSSRNRDCVTSPKNVCVGG